MRTLPTVLILLLATAAAAGQDDAPAPTFEAGDVPAYVELDKGETITFELRDGSVRTVKLIDFDRTSAQVLIGGEAHRIGYRPQDVPAHIAGMRIGVEITKAWSDRMRFAWFGLKKDCRLFLSDASRPVVPEGEMGFPLSPASVIRRGTAWGGGWLASRRDDRKDCHIGYDIYGPLGTKIIAMEDVTVADVSIDKDYGDMVVVEMEGRRFGYCYLHLMEAFVKAGQELKQGDEVGVIGQTGYAIYPHLHVQMMLPGGKKKDAVSDTERKTHLESSTDRVNINPAPYIDALYGKFDPKSLTECLKVNLKAVDAEGNPVKWPRLYVKTPGGVTYDVGIHSATSVRAGENPYTFILERTREKLRGEATVDVERDGQEIVIIMRAQVQEEAAKP